MSSRQGCVNWVHVQGLELILICRILDSYTGLEWILICRISNTCDKLDTCEIFKG